MEDKRELLNKTNSSIDYKQRLGYLKSKRGEILEKKEEEIVGINAKLRSVEEYQEFEKKKLESIRFYEAFGVLLYKNNLEDHYKQLTASIAKVKSNLELIKSTQEDTTQLYYNELTTALNEQAIKETHEDNSRIMVLTFLMAILAIMFTLIIIPIQNAASRYGQGILDDFLNDAHIWYIFLAIVFLALVLWSNNTLFFFILIPLELGLIIFSWKMYRSISGARLEDVKKWG